MRTSITTIESKHTKDLAIIAKVEYSSVITITQQQLLSTARPKLLIEETKHRLVDQLNYHIIGDLEHAVNKLAYAISSIQLPDIDSRVMLNIELDKHLSKIRQAFKDFKDEKYDSIRINRE